VARFDTAPDRRGSEKTSPHKILASASNLGRSPHPGLNNARSGSAKFDACDCIAEIVEIAHCGINRVRYERKAIVWAQHSLFAVFSGNCHVGQQ